MTSISSQRIDGFDQWCLRRILRIPYTAHVTNDEVRRGTCQPPATLLITTRRLYINSATLLKPATQSWDHPRHHELSERPSTVSHRTGNARGREVDQDERIWLRTITRISSTTWASTRCGGPFQVASICGPWMKYNGTRGNAVPHLQFMSQSVPPPQTVTFTTLIKSTRPWTGAKN